MDKEKRETEKVRSRPKASRVTRWFGCRAEDIYCRKVLLLVAVSLVISALLTPSFTSERPPMRPGDVAAVQRAVKRLQAGAVA